MIFILIMLVFVAFLVGVIVGPQIQAMIKTCQDDAMDDRLAKWSSASNLPKAKAETDVDPPLTYDPLIGPGDYWPAKKPVKRNRKGKRKK